MDHLNSPLVTLTLTNNTCTSMVSLLGLVSSASTPSFHPKLLSLRASKLCCLLPPVPTLTWRFTSNEPGSEPGNVKLIPLMVTHAPEALQTDWADRREACRAALESYNGLMFVNTDPREVLRLLRPKLLLFETLPYALPSILWLLRREADTCSIVT